MNQNQFLESYSKFLQKFLKLQKPPRLAGQWSRLARPLKVVFDCSNGVAGLVLKKIKSPLNSKFIILNSEPDGDFPAHGPNPSKPGATKQLQAAVKKHKADLGIIFDADGDRMLCVDNKSRFVDPEVSARLLIWHLKPKKIIIDTTTGWLVKKLATYNQKLITSKVGQYFIKQKMRAENADFGAERSGHYYFREFFGLDSGILAAIEVINAVSELPYKLSDFVDFLPQYYRSEIDISVNQRNQRQSALLLKKIEQTYKNQALKISRLDGLTMEFADWWFNLRFSQTEPLLRLNIEALEKSKV
ncbi:MAG: hypothetical protein Q8N22_02495 [bacterium]|nr:hypothetical protein [bacterium]